MTFVKLILANRANAQKSCGPKTPAGKRRSSANSRIHGLYGKNIPFDAQCAEDFRTLHAAYSAEYQPSNDIEESQVRQLALAEARQTWAIRTSTQRIDNACDALPPGTHPHYRVALAIRNLGHSFDLLGRLESRFLRQAFQAHDRLAKIKERTALLVPKRVNSLINRRFSPADPHPDLASLPAIEPTERAI